MRSIFSKEIDKITHKLQKLKNFKLNKYILTSGVV